MKGVVMPASAKVDFRYVSANRPLLSGKKVGLTRTTPGKRPGWKSKGIAISSVPTLKNGEIRVYEYVYE